MAFNAIQEMVNAQFGVLQSTSVILNEEIESDIKARERGREKGQCFCLIVRGLDTRAVLWTSFPSRFIGMKVTDS